MNGWYGPQLISLQWTKRRRYTILLIMSLWAFTANWASATVASALQIMAFQIRSQPSFADLSRLVAVNVLMIGLSNIVWVPMVSTSIHPSLRRYD